MAFEGFDVIPGLTRNLQISHQNITLWIKSRGTML
jgi:hypothetical protein